IGVVLAGVVIGNSLGGWIADRSPRRATLSVSIFLCGGLTLSILSLFSGLGSWHQPIDNWIAATFGTVQHVPSATEAGVASLQIVDSGYILQAKIVLYAAAFFLLPMI